MSVPRKSLSFYGRQNELHQLGRMLTHGSWFFMQTSGRRRIGKTALIQRALQRAGITRTLYIQIPDSDPAGVVVACNGYLETFGIDDTTDGRAGAEPGKEVVMGLMPLQPSDVPDAEAGISALANSVGYKPNCRWRGEWRTSLRVIAGFAGDKQ